MSCFNVDSVLAAPSKPVQAHYQHFFGFTSADSLQVISADGELNAARALKEAAETISQSSTAMQLRYLQTLNIIAAERGSTIVFPIPIDMLGPMVTDP